MQAQITYLLTAPEPARVINATKNFNTGATRMWANAQRDGCPAEYTWRPLFNAAKFG